MFFTWQITLSAEERGSQPSLMPHEIKIKDNRVMSISGRGLSRTIRLENAVKTLTPADVQIQRDLAEFVTWPSLEITGIDALGVGE